MTFEELGARRLEVEVALVKAGALVKAAGGNYDIDIDTDVYYRCWIFPVSEKAKARRKAKAVAHHKASAFGSATIIEQVVDWFEEDDRIAEWANVGEAEYVD
jgi:hypothetical protein